MFTLHENIVHIFTIGLNVDHSNWTETAFMHGKTYNHKHALNTFSKGHALLDSYYVHI